MFNRKSTPRRAYAAAAFALLLPAALCLGSPTFAAQSHASARKKPMASHKKPAASHKKTAASAKRAPIKKAAATSDLPKTASAAVKELQHTPDGAVRAFLVSMITPDPATLQQVILPVSADDFNLLVSHSPVSPDSRKVLVSRIADMPLKPLAAGDEVALPNGKKFTVQKSDVGVDHVLLQIPGGPIPVLVQRIRGAWFVNANPIVAARREAAHQQIVVAKKRAADIAKETKKAKNKK